MPEQTIRRTDGTQITTRTPEVVPNLKEPCQAIVTTQIAITEPMSDGTWRLVTAFTDNYNLILENRENMLARQEIIDRLREIKDQWKSQNAILSLENLLLTVHPNSLKTEEKTSSDAPLVDEN